MFVDKIIVFVLLILVISNFVKYLVDFFNDNKIKSDSYLYLYIIILPTICISLIIFNQIFYKNKKIEKDFSIVHPASL